MEKSGNFMSAVAQSQKKQTVVGRQSERMGTPCVLQSSFLQGPSSSRRQNLQWAIALCDWHPTQTTLLITFAQKNWVRRSQKERVEAELVSGKKSFLVILHFIRFEGTGFFFFFFLFLHSRTLSAASGTNIVFASLSLGLWIPVPYLPAGTLAHKWCRLGHLSPDNEAVVPFSSLFSSLANCSRSLSYLCVTKEIKLQI